MSVKVVKGVASLWQYPLKSEGNFSVKLVKMEKVKELWYSQIG